MTISVKLHIKDHCIETEAKNEFRRLMDDYFASETENPDLEEKIGILREFLEISDFAILRSSDPRLSGEVESYVIVTPGSEGFNISFL